MGSQSMGHYKPGTVAAQTVGHPTIQSKRALSKARVVVCYQDTEIRSWSTSVLLSVFVICIYVHISAWGIPRARVIRNLKKQIQIFGNFETWGSNGL